MKALQTLSKKAVYIFLKEHVGIFKGTLVGCFVYFQNVI